MPDPVFDPSKPFTPAETEQAAPTFDPAKPFTDVSAAPAADASAPTFDPSKPSTRVYTLDDFKATQEAELDKDKDFSPVQFGLQNQQAIRTDPEALAKLSRLYASREKRGTTLKEKAKSFLQGVPEVVSAIGSGLARGVKTVMEDNPIAAAARIAGAASSGVEGAAQKETNAIAGELQSVPASLEAAVTGSSDLLRRSAREVKEGVGKVLPGVDSKAELGEEDWKNRLFRDIAGLEQAEQAGKGTGVVTRALGLDAEELKKVGIEVDPAAIQELSVITDPINFIPIGAGVGVVGKIAGKAGSRLIATAATAEQAAKLAEVLNKAGAAASKLGTASDAAAGKLTQAAGKTLQAAGEVGDKGIRALGGTASGVGLGALAGGDLISALGGAGIAKAGPRIVSKVGKGLEALAPAVPAAAGVARTIGTEAAKGVGEGLLLGLPFSLGARPEEEQYVLGAAGLGGAVRAAATGVKLGGRAAQERLAGAILRDVEQAPGVESPGYGSDALLDDAHTRATADLPAAEQNLVNRTRELFRQDGVEVYLVDEATFNREAGGDVKAHGFFTDIGESVAPDGTTKPLVRVFLNKNAEALPHEVFHALRSVDPKTANSLLDSIQQSWTPEQKAQFKEVYESALNGHKPKDQWTKKISDEALLEEMGAEVFSRVFSGSDLSGVAPGIAQRGAQFASSVLEKLGFQLRDVSPELPREAGRSTLGVRGGTPEISTARGIVRDLLGRVAEEPREPAIAPVPEPPARVTPADLSGRPAPVPAPAAPPIAPKAPPAPAGTPRNIRATRGQQNDFAARRAQVTGVDKARTAAAKASPEVQARVNELADALETGTPVVELTYRSVATPTGPDAPAGRTARRSEQESAYIQEGLNNAPADIREAYQKVGVVTRLEPTKDTVQAVVMSLDKVIANVHRIVKDAAEKGVSQDIPYEVVDGKLTDNAWGQVVDDLQSYAANQSNGFRGDGRRLVRPTDDIGVSIPGENPDYSPRVLSEDRANFLNMVQGLNPPLTARSVKGGLPGNVKGQLVAELQGRTPETPSVIRPQDITKQNFKEPAGRSVKETNPLRNKLAADGVKVRELIEVTERVNLDELESVKQRPDLNFSAPVTDTIRAGFLPGQETDRAVRSGFLPDAKPSQPTPSKEIRDLATGYAKRAGIDYRPSRDYATIPADVARGLADFYESAKSSPEDPTVQASYAALAKETLDQYQAMVDAGYKIEPFEGKGEPYKSSAEAVADIRDNKHLYFLKTEGAFGSGPDVVSTNPMLNDSGISVNGQRLLVNDVFRAVHDFFGHGKEGYQFGPRGEFNAWRTHSEMFSPEAQGALAAETLAQNAWVNFGKHLRNADGSIPQKGESGYVAPQSRPFADQKNIVVPESMIQQARAAASKFLPEGKTVEQYGKELLDGGPDDFKPAMDAIGGLTNGAWDLGMRLTNPDDVQVLRSLSEEARARGQAAMKAGDFTNAMPYVMKGQFFREAYEAATGTGSVKTAWGAGRMPEGYKPPFPGEGAGPEGIKLLPKTEAGRKLAEQGYEFKITGQPGTRGLTILKGGVNVGELMSSQQKAKMADINSALVRREERGKGVGEAAYRELLAQLKEDGVTKVGGTVVAPQPLAIRRKIFGDDNMTVMGSKGKVSAPEAMAEFNTRSDPRSENFLFPTFYEVFNEIKPDKVFLPEANFADNVDPIVQAAIRTPKGRIFTGAWHGEALMKIADEVNEGTLGEPLPSLAQNFQDPSELGGFGVDGFVTRSGKFLDRKQAFDHAEKIKQLRENPQGYAVLSGRLESKEFAENRSFLPASEISKELDPIKRAAIRTKAGRVFEGAWHGEAYQHLVDAVSRGQLDEKLPTGFRSLTDLLDGLMEGSDTAQGFIEDGFVTESGKFLNRAQALDHAEKIGQLKQEAVDAMGPQSRMANGVLESDEFKGTRAFLPKAKVKRDEQGRPLTRDGLVNYELFYKERTEAQKKQEATDMTDLEAKVAAGKYAVEPEQEAPAGQLTGWVLPNNEFVPLDTAFHEQFLAKNSKQLNEDFGTSLGTTPDPEERFAALQKGFVRVRYTPNDGTVRIEAAAKNWTPKTRRTLLNQLESHAGTIDRVYAALMDEKGNIVDSVAERVMDLEGADKISAFDTTLASLKAGTSERRAGAGPGLVARARSFGEPTEGGEGKFLPKERENFELSNQDGTLHGYVRDGHAEVLSIEANVPGKGGGSRLAQKFTDWARERGATTLGGAFVNPAALRVFEKSVGSKPTSVRVIEDWEGDFQDGHAREADFSLVREAAFLPKAGEDLFGNTESADLKQRAIRQRIAENKVRHPEAHVLEFQKDDQGQFVLNNGNPRPLVREYAFLDTPLAKETGKGIRDDAKREDAYTDALAERITKAFKTAAKNPDIAAGVKWYSTARTRLKKLFGDDTKLFAELLGATSARTAVDLNFNFALEAYNQFKAGAYDDLLAKYREGVKKFEQDDIADYAEATNDPIPTRAAFLDWWIDKHDLTPLQSNGKKFGMNSRAVLKVLNGSWRSEVKGPKTPNFTGNLTGETFEATIDVWAARLLHRLSNEGNEKRWRILPGNETSVSDADFFIGQSAFRKAANKLDIKPDALQAIMWFAEKDHWEKNGWTDTVGAAKSDFNVLLAKTENKGGRMQIRSKQQDLFDINPDELKRK